MSATSHTPESEIKKAAASAELPEGWEFPVLGQVVSIRQGNSKLTKKNYKPDGTYTAFSGSGPDGITDFYEHEGRAIILSSVGARCGKCFPASGKWSAIANTAIIRAYLDDERLYSYLFYMLNNENFWPKGGSAQPFVQTGAAQREVSIPLPPLAEQGRIVAKIEELLIQVNSVRIRLARVSHVLKRFRQAVLAAASSGQLTQSWRENHPEQEPAADLLEKVLQERRKRWNDGKHQYKEPNPAEANNLQDLPLTWCYVSLDQLLSEPLANGRSVPDRDGGFPVLRLTALKNGLIDLRERKSGAWTENQARQFLVKQNDFLISRGNGSLSLVGRGGLVASTPDPVAYPDTLIRVRLCSGIEKGYLRFAWDSDLLRKQIESAAHTTAGIHKISQKDIVRFAVPLPPFEEQHEIVRRVEALFKLADSIEKRVEMATKRADKLTQAILAKAFRGELVPTEAELARREDRDFEPASVLLERVRSSRQSDRKARPGKNGSNRVRKKIHE